MPRVVQVLSILSSLKSNYSQDCASFGCCSFQISPRFVLSSLSLQIHSLAFIQGLNWRYSLETLWVFPKFLLLTSAPSLILCLWIQYSSRALILLCLQISDAAVSVQNFLLCRDLESEPHRKPGSWQGSFHLCISSHESESNMVYCLIS